MPKAGKHTIRLDFSSPKRDGTVTIKFRITNDAGGNKFDITATFQVTKGESAGDKAKKAKDAIKAQIDALAEANRGAEVAQSEVNFPGGKKLLMPTIFIRNKQGFSLGKFDYDNGKTKEKARASTLDTSDGDENASDDRQDDTAIRFYGDSTKGTATVAVGEHPEVRIETGGLSLTELHETLAARMQETGIAVELVAEGKAEPKLRISEASTSGVAVAADDDGLGFELMLGEEESA